MTNNPKYRNGTSEENLKLDTLAFLKSKKGRSIIEKSKQSNLHKSLAKQNQKPKRPCDCWLDVGQCYCEPENN